MGTIRLVKNTLLYFLIDPIRNEPFYIGIGGKARPRQHFTASGCAVLSHKVNRIKVLRAAGVTDDEMIVVIAENISREDALVAEEFLVEQWGRRIMGRGPLTNVTSGGPRSPLEDAAIRAIATAKALAARERLGESYKSKLRAARHADSAEVRERRSRSLKAAASRDERKRRAREIGLESYAKWGEKMHAARRLPHNAEKCKANAVKASAAAKAALADPNRAMALSEKRKAIWADPVYRARMSEERKARWRDDEYRDKMRQAKSAANKSTPEQSGVFI